MSDSNINGLDQNLARDTDHKEIIGILAAGEAENVNMNNGPNPSWSR